MANYPYPLTVALVDESQGFRETLRLDLEKHRGLEVVAEAGDGRSAIELVKRYKPDVVVMALVMPVMDGVNATLEIKTNSPDTQVIILTKYANQDNYDRAIKAGASILITKNCPPRQVYRSILSCMYGGPPSECIQVAGPLKLSASRH